MAEATTSSQGTTLPRPANEGCSGWWNQKDANGNTPLHLAAQNGHLAVIKSLLGLGSVIEERNLKGQTPLMLAVYAGQEEATRCLVEAGADLSTESEDKSSIWHAAAFSGNVAIMQYLSKRTNTKDSTKKIPEKATLIKSENDIKNAHLDRTNNIPIHSVKNEKVHKVSSTKSSEKNDGEKKYNGAAINNGRNKKKEVIDKRKQQDWEKVYRECELISSSDSEDELSPTKIKMLLCVDDEATAAHDDEKREILKRRFEACSHKFVFDKQMDETVLRDALNFGSVSVLSYLVSKKVDLNVQRFGGCRPIHLSAVAGNLEAFELLIKSGADYNLPTVDGRTALHFAANRKRVSIVKKLLALGVDPCFTDAMGNSPLHLAAVRQNNLEVCQILIENGACLLERNVFNETPYDIAVKKGCDDIAELLSPIKWL